MRWVWLVFSRALGCGLFLWCGMGLCQTQGWRDNKVKTGDDLRYAEPAFDDSDWLSYRQWRQTEEGRRFKGQVWMRQTLTFDDMPEGMSRAMVVVVLATCEVYLDGQLIGSNGKVGANKQEEMPGNSIFMVAIPPELNTPGPHQLAFRFSNHYGNYHFGILGMGVSEINQVNSALRRLLLPFVLSSIFPMVAIYFFLVFAFSYREPAYIHFAILNLLVGVLYVVEHWRMFGYPYYFHEGRLLAVIFLSGGVNLFLTLFFLYAHRLSKRYLWGFVGLAILLGMIFGDRHDGVSYGFFLSGLAIAQLLTARALWLKRPHALWGFVGCAIAIGTLVVSGRNFLEGPFFYCFILLIVLIMVSLSLQIRETRSRYQEARLNSLRLETELLKKHIQPHFMMNTLTAAMEWVERDPPSAVRFIQALAKEMRTLFEASGRKLILLSEEIAMCEAHLETLAFRMGQQHVLEVEGGHSEGISVPPAIFLTLLENGLTHGLPDQIYHFKLKWDLEGRHFCFEVDHQEAADETIVAGTGTRYIKARLEESFPGRWQFRQQWFEGTWRSTISWQEA